MNAVQHEEASVRFPYQENERRLLIFKQANSSQAKLRLHIKISNIRVQLQLRSDQTQQGRSCH